MIVDYRGFYGPNRYCSIYRSYSFKNDATEKQIIQLCLEAKENSFAAVCVNPYYINLASKLLAGTKVKIATVIGFPLGANSCKVKAYEALEAFKAGADEIDMVINIGALKDNQTDIVQREIQEVVAIAKNQPSEKIVKVIIETALLTDEEKTRACEIILNTGAHFVKTSTGFSSGGATIQDIKLLKSIVEDQVLIKASGGIKNYETALAMLEAGANRIGTSSGVEIVSGHETM